MSVARLRIRFLDTKIDCSILSCINVVESFSKTLYVHFFCRLSTRREDPCEGCLFSAMSSPEEIAFKNQLIFVSGFNLRMWVCFGVSVSITSGLPFLNSASNIRDHRISQMLPFNWYRPPHFEGHQWSPPDVLPLSTDFSCHHSSQSTSYDSLINEICPGVGWETMTFEMEMHCFALLLHIYCKLASS